MPKVFTSKTQQIGEIGENIACKFLMKQGFDILERNYTKKWGEIDIVGRKAKKLYFIEVKSVSRDFSSIKDTEMHVKDTSGEYRAEDNMHPWKLKRLSRTIQTYLLSKNFSDETEWQVDLLVVYLDLNTKKARIKVVSDIIL